MGYTQNEILLKKLNNLRTKLTKNEIKWVTVHGNIAVYFVWKKVGYMLGGLQLLHFFEGL